MSLCQPKNSSTSCGACCGVFNMILSKDEIHEILKRRTIRFTELVDYQKNWTFAVYRKEIEQIEELIEKKDPTTYNCPFLGFINSKQTKIGCLIHPCYTKDPTSQNFSFYGASICQIYDCKIKQSPNALVWKDFLSKQGFDYFEYSNLASDHITLELIEKIVQDQQISLISFLKENQDWILQVLNHKFQSNQSDLLHQTSFEISMESDQISPYEKLKARLQNFSLNYINVKNRSLQNE